jgi:hypothetical protein
VATLHFATKWGGILGNYFISLYTLFGNKYLGMLGNYFVSLYTLFGNKYLGMLVNYFISLSTLFGNKYLSWKVSVLFGGIHYMLFILYRGCSLLGCYSFISWIITPGLGDFGRGTFLPSIFHHLFSVIRGTTDMVDFFPDLSREWDLIL